MFVYRLTSDKHADDLTGQGAWLHGSRWNSPGIRMLYTGTTLSLCTCEVLVHLDKDLIPDNFVVVTIEIPDYETYPISEIPPSDPQTALYGDEWIKGGSSLILYVKSIVIPSEYNILINPSHSEMNLVKITDISPYNFDDRFFS